MIRILPIPSFGFVVVISFVTNRPSLAIYTVYYVSFRKVFHIGNTSSSYSILTVKGVKYLRFCYASAIGAATKRFISILYGLVVTLSLLLDADYAGVENDIVNGKNNRKIRNPKRRPFLVVVVFDPFDISIQTETVQIGRRFLANKFVCRNMHSIHIRRYMNELARFGLLCFRTVWSNVIATAPSIFYYHLCVLSDWLPCIQVFYFIV